MRVSGTCRKLPGIRRPANTAVGSTAAPANAAGNSRTTAASDSRRAAGEARTGPARSLVTRGGRIPAAPRGGNASSAKVSAGAAHERVSDQAAGRAALGPLAAGRLHASSGTQVSWAQGGGTWDSSSEPRLAALGCILAPDADWLPAPVGRAREARRQLWHILGYHVMSSAAPSCDGTMLRLQAPRPKAVARAEGVENPPAPAPSRLPSSQHRTPVSACSQVKSSSGVLSK